MGSGWGRGGNGSLGGEWEVGRGVDGREGSKWGEWGGRELGGGSGGE